ncbi:hypothetical protein ScPMuIL_014771 [Solemya velum]
MMRKTCVLILVVLLVVGIARSQWRETVKGRLEQCKSRYEKCIRLGNTLGVVGKRVFKAACVVRLLACKGNGVLK